LRNTDDKPGDGSVMEALRAVASNLLRALITRLELAASDIEEQLLRLSGVLLLLILGGCMLAMALWLGVLLLIVMFWDGNRILVISLLLAAFSGSGLLCLLWARRQLATRPALLSTTLSELRKDKDALHERH
jgi:uncharacterized membrane protein YqjE